MTYDHWKTTNPEDRWIGPDPAEEDEEPDYYSIGYEHGDTGRTAMNGAPPDYRDGYWDGSWNRFDRLTADQV